MDMTDDERSNFVKAMYSYLWCLRDSLEKIPKNNYNECMALDKVASLCPDPVRFAFEELSPSQLRILDTKLQEDEDGDMQQ
jgi:hypothetical protein